jgi:hypothetical protein
MVHKDRRVVNEARVFMADRRVLLWAIETILKNVIPAWST